MSNHRLSRREQQAMFAKGMKVVHYPPEGKDRGYCQADNKLFKGDMYITRNKTLCYGHLRPEEKASVDEFLRVRGLRVEAEKRLEEKRKTLDLVGRAFEAGRKSVGGGLR